MKKLLIRYYTLKLKWICFLAERLEAEYLYHRLSYAEYVGKLHNLQVRYERIVKRLDRLQNISGMEQKPKAVA